MRKLTLVVLLAAFMATVPCGSGEDKPVVFPSFRMQEIDTGLPVCWNLGLADVNGDGKTDLIVAAPNQMVWCENPTWKAHPIVQGTTKPNNNGFAITKLMGDSQLSIGLAGGWKPFNTKDDGTLVLLRPGKKLEEPWNVLPIGGEPMPHRVRFADVFGEGKPQFIVAPLMGRDSTVEGNWLDGKPVRVLAFRVPKDPTKDRWVPEVIDESLHVIHGLTPVDRVDGKGADLLLASYEGVHLVTHKGDGKFEKRLLTAGNQENPKGHRGSSDVKPGRLKNGKKFLVTIEPWHGNQIVVYTEPEKPEQLWDRHLIDEQLKMGHAIWCADLDGDGDEEIVVGVQVGLADKAGERCGVRLYKATDGKGAKWSRHVLDEGVVEVEDLAAADLSGSGRLDIVAIGKQSGKVRIYWNEGLKK